MRKKVVGRISIACVMGITIFAIVGMSVLTRTSVMAVGPIAAGAAVAIGMDLVAELKNAIKEYGGAIVCVKAKVDGPDGDDKAIDFEYDRDQGLDWSLDAWTNLVEAPNDVDNNEETPYSPGDAHYAYVELHFESIGGKWYPDPNDCRLCKEDEKNEFYGWVSAHTEDDPTPGNRETRAMAAAAFSEDGITVEYCYTADTLARPGWTIYQNVQNVDCSPIPEFVLQQGAAFLASVDRFAFESAGGDQVVIRPLLGPTIDLFHSYLQEGSNFMMFPVLRGHDEGVQELKRDIYEERIRETSYVLSEGAPGVADLTIVGAALHFDELLVTRSGRSDLDLLEEYFSSGSAVTIVAPEHAQDGYEPQVAFRTTVHSGQDITAIIGRDYTIPVNGDPGEPVEDDPLVGLVFAVNGDVNESVNIAVNTEGHFVRDIANDAWPGGNTTIEFKIPEMNFHHESPSSLSDIAIATPTYVGGIIEFPQLEEPGAFAPDLSEHSHGASAGVIAGAIAGVTALVGASWYIRRRRTGAT